MSPHNGDFVQTAKRGQMYCRLHTALSAARNTWCQMVGCFMDAECEGIWKKSLVHYLCISLEIMRKNTEILVRLASRSLRLEVAYLQDKISEFLLVHQVCDLRTRVFL